MSDPPDPPLSLSSFFVYTEAAGFAVVPTSVLVGLRPDLWPVAAVLGMLLVAASIPLNNRLSSREATP